MFDTPYIIPVAFFVAWTVVSVARAKNGIGGPFSRAGWHSNPENMEIPPMFQKLLDKAMAERDEEISELKERIQTLEKIVIDTHKSSRLSDEIEKLREKN
jgi:hypothetical protein